MAIRSYADVPNRIVRIFLQEAGRIYDQNRGFDYFRKMTPELLARFAECCAYCGQPASPKLVEEHLVPINRESAGLHAWGNIVPACKTCNDIKAGNPWGAHPMLNESRRRAIQAYIDEYRYEPDVREIRLVVAKLYDLANVQTRAFIEFGLIASRPYIAGLHATDDMKAAARGDE